MSEFYVISLIIVLAVIAFVSLFLAFKTSTHMRMLESDMEQLNKQVKNLEYQRDVSTEELHEIRSGALGVGNRVKELTMQVSQLKDKIEELQLLDPESRMYSKANKMVASGATVEELMDECSLPRAEAELLFSMRKK